MHVLLGPGSLALGLLAPITSGCGFKVHLVGRPGGGGVPEFKRTLTAGIDKRSQPFKVAGFHTSAPQVVPYELREAVSNASVVLITATTRGEIADRIEFVHAIVDASAPGAEVIFVPCENRLAEGHRRLLDQLPARGVHCLATVVDRVCRPAEEFTDEAPRHVVAHQHGEWVLERPARAPAFVALLEQAPEVRFATSQRVAAELRRKLLLMNSTHLGIGLLALQKRQVSMSAAANDPDVQPVAIELLEEFYELLSADLDDAENRQFGAHALQIICSFDDDVPRVMSGFRRAALPEFFNVFKERITTPALRRAAGNAAAPEPFQRIARALVQVLIDDDGYADLADLANGRVDLSTERDRQALAAFREVLTGWMPAGWIDEQERAVRSALGSQYAKWL